MSDVAHHPADTGALGIRRATRPREHAEHLRASSRGAGDGPS
jgi:hypothetical protein